MIYKVITEQPNYDENVVFLMREKKKRQVTLADKAYRIKYHKKTNPKWSDEEVEDFVDKHTLYHYHRGAILHDDDIEPTRELLNNTERLNKLGY